MQVGAERLELELEGRGDPEVPAGAAHPPEQIRLLGLAGAHEPAIGGHELDGPQVVDRQAEVPLEPTDTATERQPRNARVADDAGRADEPVRLSRHIELTEERAAVHPRHARRRIHRHAAHPGHVDDEATVAARMPGGAVAAGADGQRQAVVAGEADRGRDIRRVTRAGR